jgi:hypothetical protein
VLRLDTEGLVALLESEQLEGPHVMERFATMIQREFTLPALLAQVRRLAGPLTEEMSTVSLTLYRLSVWLKSPRPYLMLCGFALFLRLGIWHRVGEFLLPGMGITLSLGMALAVPTTGVATPRVYQHIAISVWRIAQAFFLAALLGVPVGLLLVVGAFKNTYSRSWLPSHPVWPGCHCHRHVRCD